MADTEQSIEPALCPECDNGKHNSCTGWAYDDHDNLVACQCNCHRQEED